MKRRKVMAKLPSGLVERLGLEITAKGILQKVSEVAGKTTEQELKKKATDPGRAVLLNEISSLPDKVAKTNLLNYINMARDPKQRKLHNLRYSEDDTIRALCNKLKIIDFYDKLNKKGMVSKTGYEIFQENLTATGNLSFKEFWEEIDGLLHNPFTSWIHDYFVQDGLLSEEQVETLKKWREKTHNKWRTDILPGDNFLTKVRKKIFFGI